MKTRAEKQALEIQASASHEDATGAKVRQLNAAALEILQKIARGS